MKKKSAFCLGLIILVLTICPFLKSGVHLYDGYQNEGDNFLSTASLDEEIGYEWNRTWGPTISGSGRDIAIDSLDNIYLVGYAWISPPFQAVLVKYNASGNLIWSRSWDGVHDARAHAVAVDSSDNIYMGGYGYDLGFGAFDLFIVKYNSAGDVQWSRTWGGSDYERIYDLAVDSSDNVYLVGETSSWGSGNMDMVIVKYNSAGTLQWNRTWGLSGFEEAYAVGVDSSDNVYMVGTTSSFDGAEWNIVKYNSGGTLQWNRTWGGGWYSGYAYAISFDSSDNVFVAGEMRNPINGFPGVGLAKFNSLGVELYNRTWHEIDSGGIDKLTLKILY